MANRKDLNKRTIAALPIPEKGRVVWWDTRCPHLCLRVSSVAKVWYFYAKVKGRPTKVKIGTAEEVPPERAREIAGKMALKKVAGGDPADEKRAHKGEPTLGRLWDRWAESHGRALRSWREMERTYNAVWKKWENRKLSDIRKTQVSALHVEIGGKHPYAANRALDLLRALYNKAESLVGWSGPNPGDGIERYKEHKRERFLTPDEVKALVAAVAAESIFWRAYWTCALWTGARESSLTRMRWQDLHLDQSLWIIPAEFSKNGKPIPIALLPPAVDILRELRQFAPDVPWVFANRLSKTGHLMEVKGAWKRIKNRAAIKDLAVVPYTLRHTVASHLGMAGANQAIIAAALGHSNSRTSERYTHLNTDPVRAALAGVNAKLLEVAQPAKQEGNENGQAKQ